MKDYIFYKDRILWKARQNKLEDYFWKKFLIDNPTLAAFITQSLCETGEPLLIFWKDYKTWTVLTESHLIGFNNDVELKLELDEVNNKTKSILNCGPKNDKRDIEFFEVGEQRLKFWTPPGKEHFAMRNILKMFPLGKNIPSH